jgi:predicted ferric reductase
MRDVVVGIGAGVGITPFLAFLEYLAWMPLDQWVGREFHIFWMTRNPTDFLLGGDILERLQGRVAEARELCKDGAEAPTLHVHLHVTGIDAKTLAGKLFLKAVTRRSNSSFESSKSAMSSSTKAEYKKKPDFLDTYELIPALPVPIYFGRPEWIVELSAIGKPSSEVVQDFNVYICGNPMLVKSIETDVDKIQSTTRRFIVEHERFG